MLRHNAPLNSLVNLGLTQTHHLTPIISARCLGSGLLRVNHLFTFQASPSPVIPLCEFLRPRVI